jgi:hypothetical protein
MDTSDSTIGGVDGDWMVGGSKTLARPQYAKPIVHMSGSCRGVIKGLGRLFRFYTPANIHSSELRLTKCDVVPPEEDAVFSEEIGPQPSNIWGTVIAGIVEATGVLRVFGTTPDKGDPMRDNRRNQIQDRP